MQLRIATATGDETTVRFPLVLPHECFAAIFRAGRERWLRSILGGNVGSLQEYWKHALQHYRWTDEHPLRAGFVAGTIVPIGFYGDGARVTKDDSLLTMTWNSVVASAVRPSFESRMVICACPTTWLLETSVDDIAAVVSWSFGAMADGHFPSTDHLGRAWPRGSERNLRAGLPLSPGYRAALVEFRGDWEWLAKALHIPTASSSEPCYKCLCTSRGIMSWTDFREDAPWRTALRLTDTFLQAPNRSPLTRLGFDLSQIRIDVMHTVCLGVGLWINAAVLLYLCGLGHYREGPLARQLKEAWLSFKEWIHEHSLQSSQRLFTPRRLLVLGGEQQEYAELQAKAWNSRLVTNFLAGETGKLQPRCEEDHLTFTLAWALNESYHICEASPRFMNNETATSYHGVVELALRCYRDLSRRALAQGKLLYPMRPKLHLWCELAAGVRADHANPRFFHVFADEDFLRVVLKAARATPRASMAAATVRRYIVRLTLVWAGRAQLLQRKRKPPNQKRRWRLQPRL